MYRLLTALLLLAAMVSPGARAQDLCDPTTLRTFSLQFREANWLQLDVVAGNNPGRWVTTRWRSGSGLP